MTIEEMDKRIEFMAVYLRYIGSYVMFVWFACFFGAGVMFGVCLRFRRPALGGEAADAAGHPY